MMPRETAWYVTAHTLKPQSLVTIGDARTFRPEYVSLTQLIDHFYGLP